MIDLTKILSFKAEKEKQQEQAPQEAASESQSVWIKCLNCQALMYHKEVEHQHHTCPKCNFHMKLPALKRIALLADKGTFKEYDKDLAPNDPLGFVDKTSYKKRLEVAKEKNGKQSSVISGECLIGGKPVQMAVFDFAFMGGSLGSVEGEKIARAVQRALDKRHGMIIISTSGGARMQESTFSLLQMSKTSAALKRLDEAKLPYISILVDPTMGGVSASFAMLGDIIMAEPGALIGFAGQRVIEQTINAKLPEGFQRSEFLLEKGSIDMIVDRKDMKNTLIHLLDMMLDTTEECSA